jgi:hypothetical protein
MSNFFENPTDRLDEQDLERAEAIRAAREKQAKAKAKAGGPKTAAGKAISACNAFKHGFAAVKPIIDNEDEQAWNAHLDAYMSRFLPTDQVEADTVRRIAFAMWRFDRLTAVETALLNIEYDYHEPIIDGVLGPNLNPVERLAISMKQSAGDHAFDLCRRYINDAERAADKAIKTFYLLQSKRSTHTVAGLQASQQPVANQQVRNEPRPNRPQPPVDVPKTAQTGVRVVARSPKPASKPPKDRKIA